MVIPTKFIFRGDQLKGRALVGDGHRAMTLLENLMSFQGLEQYNIQVTPYPGALIKCSKAFGLRTVEILTGGGLETAEKYESICLCNCNFTHGYILKKNPEKLEDISQLYDVAVCFGKKKYKVFKDIIASDFTEYEVGQKVILVPYYKMAFGCCADEGEEGFPATGCNPIESELINTNVDWRTTLRIIPWCAIKLPKWVSVKRSVL